MPAAHTLPAESARIRTAPAMSVSASGYPVMRGIVSLPEECPVSFRRNAEHDAIDVTACIAGSASVVIDDVLPGRGPRSRDRPQCRVDPFGESPQRLALS